MPDVLRTRSFHSVTKLTTTCILIGLIILNQSLSRAMKEGNKMIEVLGTITATFILAILMRGSYLMVKDAQDRYNERNK